MSLIYNVKKLNCSYRTSSSPVLSINNLTIDEGELIFFLGVSGVGKSTLIESLGMMTNTIQFYNDNIIEYYNRDGKVFDLASKWKETNRNVANFRAQEFSFIFQSTNLFESVSILDNVVIPSFAEKIDIVTKEALTLLKSFLPLDKDEDDYSKRLAGDLSGGQKQRLAFVRALTTCSRVLFCDEPTGNLDVGNAKKVMNKLRDFLNTNNSTALIVSHDIHLAVEYASKIVLVTKKVRSNKSHYGSIEGNNQYVRCGDKKWKSDSAEFTKDEFIDFLIMHFINSVEDEK